MFWDVHANETRHGMSWCNATEAQVVVALLRSLFARYPSVDFRGKIGVLTPYSSQLRELRRQYQQSLTKDQQLWVESNTVDAFQGREKDIVIFTCVRAGAQKGIGFVADTRRMNVALTRAKQAIWVVGNAAALGRNRDWRKYMRCDHQFYPLLSGARTNDHVSSCRRSHLREAGHGFYTVKNGDEAAAIVCRPTQAVLNQTSSKRPHREHNSSSEAQKKQRRSASASEVTRDKSVKGIVNRKWLNDVICAE